MIPSYIVLLPFLAACYSGLLCRFISARHAQIVTALCVSIAALLSLYVFIDIHQSGPYLTKIMMPWIRSGDFEAQWALQIDMVTATMLVVVSGVSSLVHIYSIGYMSHDGHIQRFMSYLSLFTFFMLVLVTSNNILQLFVGWEGVGVCSYLLIGFWFHKPSANKAAIKAFVVNRVGDLSFIVGILTLYHVFGSIEFAEIFKAIPYHTEKTLTLLGIECNVIELITLLLFIGCMGKSAQIGLHTWLPDAMEGPTPVSALIHAATMVTAGVFLVIRMSPLFEYAPHTLTFMTYIGAITCVFAATIALTQHDIKRVIAYSTCSQLGYMFFACGVSAYHTALFHLMTHAFFKALLFLGAGSVIHAMSDEQDMRYMGGLYKKIPYTHALMLIGSLALGGIFPFAGYFSKDAIVLSAYHATGSASSFAFWMGVTAAFMTAFYSWRLLIMTFYGTSRADKKVFAHVHESPYIMLIPLIILAVGAIFSGYVGEALGMVSGQIENFWAQSIVILDTHRIAHLHDAPLWAAYLPMGVGAIGIMLAYVMYLFVPKLPQLMATYLKPIYMLFYHKWYVDELYDTVFVKPAHYLAKMLWVFGDQRIIDYYGPDGVANVSKATSKLMSRLQTGYVYHYALAMFVGLLVFIGLFVIYTF